jgi:glycosyltransferase involved in cell wall biosynthesis
LLVTPMLPKVEAGGAIPLVLHAQLSGLRRHHEVTLVSAATGEHGEEDAVEQLRLDGVDVHVARRSVGSSERWRRRRGLAAGWLRGGAPWRTVWFAVRELQAVLDGLTSERTFDVVALEDNSMGRYVLPASLPRVLTEHEVRRGRAVARPPLRPSLWPAWAFREMDWHRWPAYQRDVWSAADLVQVFTPRDADAVSELAPELRPRVRLNPFGIELPPLAETDREEPATFAFVGNFTHPPNMDAARWLLDEVMPRLRRRGVAARFLLAGSSMPAELLTTGLGDVEVLPDVPRVEDVLARAELVIAPVRTGGGMRMKVLHALASGKAVVTTRRGAEGLDLSEPAPLLLAETADETVDAVVTLLEDPARRAELGRCARLYVERHHSPEAYAHRLEATYREAVEMHRARR